MARLIETDSFTNKDISAAVAIGAYTANATRALVVRVCADAVAGNGDYIVYATLQVGGAGSAYRMIPITTAAAASGLTAISFVSGVIPVDSGDVVTVYLDGLAGDTTTPDTRVDWYEHDYLRPATADRTIDVTAGGLVNGNALEATLTAIKGAGWSDETLVTIQSAAEGSGGSGARTVVVTVTDGTDPLESASVRLTKSGISYVLATSALGVATFSLDDGTYALAVSLAGWAFTPTTVVVDGNEAVTAAMSQVVIPAPSEPDACVCYTYARDIHGTAAASAPVVFRLEAVDGMEGSAFNGDTHTVTSAADGLVQVQLPQGAKASVFDRNSRWRTFDVPVAARYELQAVII